MVKIECVTERLGCSTGVTIPKDAANEHHIKPDQVIRLNIVETPLAKDLWDLGPIKDPMPTQKIKNLMRKGW